MNRSSAAPDHIAYLDAAASTQVGADYKQRLRDALDLSAGHTVLDIGCGPATDLAALADAVSLTGSVIGVDQDPRMVEAASRRVADRANITVVDGDAHSLPFDDASVDRARVDRVLQHVADPTRAIAEARRVLRVGGLFGMAEPDWDTLAVADEDVEASRRFARYVAGRVRNATIGRQLVGLAAKAGMGVESVRATAVLFTDFATAERVLGLRRNTTRAVEAGVLNGQTADAWLDRLESGPFLAGFTFYLVVARV